jgi:hypothetical protein
LPKDYTFFAQVVDLEDTTRWGSQDLGKPQVRTSTWPPGETQLVSMSFSLHEETPAEVYPVIVGVYTIPDGGIEHLQLVAQDGRITQDYLLRLTPLRVDE